MLNMPKFDLPWHEQDLADELAEYQEATGVIATWSELSDVAYTYTRAIWSGHTITLPLKRHHLYIGIVYMLPKYTLRWRFFRKLGHQFDTTLHISEVRNPKKIHKLHTIAEKYHLNPDHFAERAEKLLRWSVLLP